MSATRRRRVASAPTARPALAGSSGRARSRRAVPAWRGAGSRVREAARTILADVRARGAVAVRDAAARFGGGLADGRLLLGADELAAAADALPAPQRDALEAAIANVRRFAETQRPASTRTQVVPGVEIERRWLPVERVGAYVPGGSAPYPSSLVMTVVPARVAGVGAIVVASPADAGGAVNPVLLGAAGLLGVDALLVAGGVQAIGALAYGLAEEGLPPADLVVGPGSAWVTAAKVELAGEVAIDLPAGPSEGLVLADATRGRLDGRRGPDHAGGARRRLPCPARHAGRGARGRGRGRGPAPPRDGVAARHPRARPGRSRTHRPGRGCRRRDRVRQRLRPRAPVDRRRRSRGRGGGRAQRGLDLRRPLVARVGRRLRVGREPRPADRRPGPCLRPARGRDVRQVQPGAADHARGARDAPTRRSGPSRRRRASSPTATRWRPASTPGPTSRERPPDEPEPVRRQLPDRSRLVQLGGHRRGRRRALRHPDRPGAAVRPQHLAGAARTPRRAPGRGPLRDDAVGVPAGRLPQPRRGGRGGVRRRDGRARAGRRRRRDPRHVHEGVPARGRGRGRSPSRPTRCTGSTPSSAAAARSSSRASGATRAGRSTSPAVREAAPIRDARLALQPQQPDRPGGARRGDRRAARRPGGRRGGRWTTGAGGGRRRGVQRVHRRVRHRAPGPPSQPRRRPDGVEGVRARRPAGRVRARRRLDHPARRPVPAAGLDQHRLGDRGDGGAARPGRHARQRRARPRASVRASPRASRPPGCARSRRSPTSSSSTWSRPSARRRRRSRSCPAASSRARSATATRSRTACASRCATPPRTTASSPLPTRSGPPCQPSPGSRPHDHAARHARRRDAPRAPRPRGATDARDGHHDHAGPRRDRLRVDRDRHRLLRPPPGLARPPRPVRPRGPRRRATSTSTSTTRSRTSALVLGSAFAAALGDRAGIRRFGDSSVPMDESARDGGRRRRRAPVRRGRPPVPCRARRDAAAAARRARDRGVRAGRPGPPCTSGEPAATTTTWPRPRSRRSAARCAWRARRIRDATASPRPRARWDERQRGAADDRRGRRLRRRQPRLDRAGACSPPGLARGVRRRRMTSTAPTSSSSRASGRRRPRWSGCASAGFVAPDPRLDRRRPPVPRHLPRPPAPVRGQRRGRRGHAGRPARPDRPPRGRAHPPAHRLEPGRADASAPGVRRHRRRRGLLLRPLVRRGTRPWHRGRRHARHDRARSPVRVGRRPGAPARRPVPPGAVGRRRPAPDRQRRRRGRPAPDAPPARHPVPRRGRRPRREGHPVRRPRRRRRPARARRALCPRRGGRARVPRHHRRARGPRDPARHRRADRAPRVHPAHRRRRRAERRRDARRPAGGRGQGQPQHAGGRRPGADHARVPRASAARRSSWRSTPARCAADADRSVRLRGRGQGRPRVDGPRRDRLGGACRRARGRRAPRDLDRPRRDQVGLRHRAPARDHEPRPVSRSSRPAARPVRPTS